jgi:hypothetical protein
VLLEEPPNRFRASESVKGAELELEDAQKQKEFITGWPRWVVN